MIDGRGENICMIVDEKFMKNNSDIMVSICCVAYNHEQYIKDALDGFLAQKVDFKYEIIIHDDASTDSTASIIRDYEKRYPDIVKGIYQEENQFSQGIKPLQAFVFPKAQGKYIALCDGDDYWCDSEKLRKQIDFLEKHEDYSACVHDRFVVDCITQKRIIKRVKRHDCDLSFADICGWRDTLFNSVSLVARRKYISYPKDFDMKTLGDYPRALWLRINGKIRFLKDQMAVYRANVSGSWSVWMNDDDDLKKKISLTEETIKMLENVDRYSNYVYHADIVDEIRTNEMMLLEYEGKPEVILKDYKKDLIKKYSFKWFCSVVLRVKLHWFWEFQHKLRYALQEKKNS